MSNEARYLAALSAIAAMHIPTCAIINGVAGWVCIECEEPIESDPCTTMQIIGEATKDLL